MTDPLPRCGVRHPGGSDYGYCPCARWAGHDGEHICRHGDGWPEPARSQPISEGSGVLPLPCRHCHIDSAGHEPHCPS